jgi:hypothetical protein
MKPDKNQTKSKSNPKSKTNHDLKQPHRPQHIANVFTDGPWQMRPESTGRRSGQHCNDGRPQSNDGALHQFCRDESRGGGWRALLGFLCIEFNEMMPLRWHVVFMKNRFDRTFWNARSTVDALVRMNVHHLGILIEALAWANSHAGLVFATFARLGNHHCHYCVSIV